MLHTKLLNIAATGLSLMASLSTSAMAEYRLGQQIRADPARDLQAAACVPNPIKTNLTGTNSIFSEEKFLVVFLKEPLNRTNFIDVIALDATAGPAYDASVNCSLSLGSLRSLVNCTTVTSNIIFERDAVLMKCLEYSSNSVDGSDVFSSVNLYTNEICSCACGGIMGTSFDAFVAPDGRCPCSCSGNRGNCVCYAPFEDDYVNTWNDLYKIASDPLGVNVSIANVTDVEILTDCGPQITYNTTSVCLPPDETPSPTRKPTRKPTNKPTRKPTRKPTKKPVKPTRKPTKKPTKRPTHRPTHAPTVTPSVCEAVCDYYYYSTVCHYLEETGRCNLLKDRTKSFTFFAPINSAFSRLGSLTHGQMHDIIDFLILENRVETVDSLVCGRSYATLLGESTTTTCKLDGGAQDAQTDKYQVGLCNAKQGTSPEIWKTFIDAANGHILEVDEVPLPNKYGNCIPTAPPTTPPTFVPTGAPTIAPTSAPTSAPTIAPTSAPTTAPTTTPTTTPTTAPTTTPTTTPISTPISTPTSAQPVLQKPLY